MCVCAHAHTHTHARMHAHGHADTRTHATRTHARTHAGTHTRACTHGRAHTRRQPVQTDANFRIPHPRQHFSQISVPLPCPPRLRARARVHGQARGDIFRLACFSPHTKSDTLPPPDQHPQAVRARAHPGWLSDCQPASAPATHTLSTASQAWLGHWHRRATLTGSRQHGKRLAAARQGMGAHAWAAHACEEGFGAATYRPWRFRPGQLP